jgi:hypothetical protein
MVNRIFKCVFNTEIFYYRSQGVVVVTEVNVYFEQGEEV